MDMSQAEDRLHLDTTAHRLQRAMSDAQMRLQNISHRQVKDYDLHAQMWTQVWPGSNCGFGRNLDVRRTESYVIVVRAPHLIETAVVWIAGHYAYTVLDPSPAFFHDVDHRCLRGENTPGLLQHYDKRLRLTMPPLPDETPTLPMAL